MKSRVEIFTAERNNITYLKDSFASVPFKLADIREDKSNPCLDLMLMSSSPGVLSTDDYYFDIEVGKRCALSLKTQSYQRFFTMKEKAMLTMNVRLLEKSFFEFIPHPTVPHRESNVTLSNNIYLKDEAKVIWGDLVSCGRKLNGEEFEYAQIKNKTTFYFEDKIKIMEHFLLRPKDGGISGIGKLEGYSHMASLYFIGNGLNAKNIKNFIDQLIISNDERIAISSLTPFKGVIVKFLSNRSALLYEEMKYIAASVRKEHFKV